MTIHYASLLAMTIHYASLLAMTIHYVAVIARPKAVAILLRLLRRYAPRNDNTLCFAPRNDSNRGTIIQKSKDEKKYIEIH